MIPRRYLLCYIYTETLKLPVLQTNKITAISKKIFNLIFLKGTKHNRLPLFYIYCFTN